MAHLGVLVGPRWGIHCYWSIKSRKSLGDCESIDRTWSRRRSIAEGCHWSGLGGMSIDSFLRAQSLRRPKVAAAPSYRRLDNMPLKASYLAKLPVSCKGRGTLCIHWSFAAMDV